MLLDQGRCRKVRSYGSVILAHRVTIVSREIKPLVNRKIFLSYYFPPTNSKRYRLRKILNGGREKKSAILKNEINPILGNFETKFSHISVLNSRIIIIIIIRRVCEQTIITFPFRFSNDFYFKQRKILSMLRFSIFPESSYRILLDQFSQIYVPLRQGVNVHGGKLDGGKIFKLTIRVLTPAAARSTHIDT